MLNLVGNEGMKTHRMATFDGKDWCCDLRLSKTDSTLSYYYNVTGRDNNNRNEWQIVKHVLDLTCAKATEYTIYDHWNGMPEDSYLYSSAFTDCINHQEPEQMKDTA